MARSKAYRWGEDGIAGICDRYQLLVFALALWNGRDPILKERMFGLSGNEGNHGEDVKEYWFYLDNTPTHSYMRMLYKYPQREFPYAQLLEENRRRWGQVGAPEFELLDTGIFDDDRYFDVFIEYAKAGPEDICIRIEAFNRGPEAAPTSTCCRICGFATPGLGQIRRAASRSSPSRASGQNSVALVADDFRQAQLRNLQFPYSLGQRVSVRSRWRQAALHGQREQRCAALRLRRSNRKTFVKDAFHRHVIHREDCVNPDGSGHEGVCSLRVSACRQEGPSFCACV